MIGCISYYNHTKGYGFVTITTHKSPTQEPIQERFFFHHSQMRDGATPILGAFVVFGLAPGITAGKKPQAVGIRFATTQEIAEAMSPKSEVRP